MELISYLVLDYNKPAETRNALLSIRKFARHNHQIILLSNGGEQNYIFDLYKEGLIDKLIVNKINNGLGYGTEDLFRFCDTEWAIYFQNDQELAVPINDENIDYIIKSIKNSLNGQKIGAIGLAGEPCGPNTYSERAHFINVRFYNSIPKTHGGCGPFNHLKYNEQAVQEYFKENNYLFLAANPPLVRDCGFYTIRELPDGAIVRMRTDKKSVTWIKNPKEKYMFPDMTDEEWTLSINGQWTNGTIPEKYKSGSFNCWGNIED